ncbi:MAG TPA: prepilin-type N-terminal cleavage/methylation domain-containing protein [Planctomycetota bacterium]|nr:prepilin-type N-terminal cleavage/methylation domain-containing protein [Planctomycetota bacterium]
MNRSRGFTLIELMIVIAIIAIIAAIAIPGILSATRAANERNASGSLKQMGSIEVTFRSSDSDQNTINDFYTADLKGLYFIAIGTPTPVQIRMIEISVAQADVDPDESGGGYTNPAASILTQSPKAGYWYRVLENFEEPKATFTAYGVRNTDRFGFIAFPSGYPSSGRLAFITNEGGTMFKRDPGSNTAIWDGAATAGNDPGEALTSAYDDFPIDPFDPTNASGAWSKLD